MKGIAIMVMFVGPFVLYYCLRSVAVRAVTFFMMRGDSKRQAVLGSGAAEPAAHSARGGELFVESFDLDSEIVLTESQQKRWRRMQTMGWKTLAAFASALVPGVLVLTITEYISYSADGTRDPDLPYTIFRWAAT